ncbi:hypothetical protein [Alkalihalobacillus trypoxylicola]|uniref:Uncharacterized protein n=1 Tax=Alkalihalobacillus trypoxylicola TaxID=519424 RepID=A0A162EDM4_9BACI|nr:hypothetical protein [Alkalihalobacillus trypoxylicola]KYG32333.1 hypothetical protein AZF04_06095 [Alkalihalobacillus trypoxylicola]
MSQSRAKKIRLKRVREGLRNPEKGRSPFAYNDMRTRKTPTKKERLYKTKYKNHYFSKEEDRGSFYMEQILNEFSFCV